MGDLAGLSLLVGAASAAVTSLAMLRWNNRRTRAETLRVESEADSNLHKALAETAGALTEFSRAEIDAVRREVARVRAERDGLQLDVDRLRRYVAELVDAMRAAGVRVPPFRSADPPPTLDA